MTAIARLALVVTALGVLSCRGAQQGAIPVLTVMTRNVYVGTDVDRILTARTPAELTVRVEEAWALLQATDFDTRAALLAGEIAAVQPDLVGLQEITRFRVRSPGRTGPRAAVPREEAWDYLDILSRALAARGLRYVVAARVQDTDVTLERGNPTRDEVQMTDYDAILVRQGLVASDGAARNYSASLSLTLPDGTPLVLQRGWVATVVNLGGELIRFVSTHLEPADYDSSVQQAQVRELLAVLARDSFPVVLVGDLNARADGVGSATYASMLAAGFVDAWAVGGVAGASGATCCHAYDLRNPVPTLDRRIDFILLGGWPDKPAVEAWVVGGDPADRAANGLWASDHAGIAARIRSSRGGAR